MGLIDGDQRRRAAGEHLGEAGHAQALGRDEQEVELASQVIHAGLPRLGPAAARVDALGAKALGGEPQRLILHQGDERADDQSGTPTRDAGQLITQRLAGAGRHDQQ